MKCISTNDVVWEIFCIFFGCDTHWHWYSSTAPKLSSYLHRILISKCKNKSQFWTLALCHWDSCKKQSFNWLHSLGHRSCFCVLFPACWSLSTVCISTTTTLQMVEKTWPVDSACGTTQMWMGSLPTGKETSFGDFQVRSRLEINWIAFAEKWAVCAVGRALSMQSQL